MAKSELLKRIDESVRSGYLVDRDTVDPSETTTPNVPEGVSVKAIQDGILIQVDPNVDTARNHARFEAYIVYVKPRGSAAVDSSGQEIGRMANGQTSLVWQPPFGGYQGWLVAVSAISNTGYESAKTSWIGTITSTFYDDFGAYGGSDLVDLDDTNYVVIEQFEDYTDWSGGTAADNTTTNEFVEGAEGVQFTLLTSGATRFEKTVSLDLSVYGFADTDYLTAVIYAPAAANIATLQFILETSSGNYFRFDTSGLSDGLNFVSWNRSDATEVGSPDWATITKLAINVQATGSNTTATLDDWRIVKADPDDASTWNDTGKAWDFNGGIWHVVAGNRTGEPDTYDFSLAHFKDADSDWFMATVANVEVAHGQISVGVHIKHASRLGLAFRVADATLGSEDCFEVDIRSSTNTIALAQFEAGARTELASASYTFNVGSTYWIGADFRDVNNTGKIRVYVADNEWKLFRAKNRVFSYAATAPWPDGYGVGVITREQTVRFLEFRAGSPEVAYYAHVAGYALQAGAIGEGVADHGDLSGLTDDDHSQYFLLAGETTDAELHGGADLIVFSDAGSTEVARIDGATGDITTAGTVDGVDLAAFKTSYDAHDHSAGDPTQVDHANLTGVTANQHHNQAHVLATNSALGPDHSISGASSGHVLRASGATAANFQQLAHSDLGSVSADQHHAGFIGLEDNAGTAITPAADDRIQITDDGVVNADAAGNTLALSIAQGQIDHGSIGGLTGDDHSQYALLAGRSGGQNLRGGTGSGDDLLLESTSHATKGYVALNPSGGNVGVGTATPDSTLEVAGGTAVLKIASTTDGTDVSLVLERVGNTRLDWRLLDSGGDFYLQSSNDEGATWSDRLFVGASASYIGKVGIGTITPTYKLHVVGTSLESYSAYIFGDTGTGGLKVEAGSIANGHVVLEVVDSGGSTPHLRVDSNGSVLMGVTADDANTARLTLDDGVSTSFFATPTREWYISDTQIDLDLTSGAYDTKAECNAWGLRFSDSDTPFPTQLGDLTISGTWTHSAGNGWQPAVATDDNWCVILVPLMRPDNWQLEFTINYNPTDVAHQIGFHVGYITQSNHIGAKVNAYDTASGFTRLICALSTNDGDDTYTVQYTGSNLAGTGVRKYGIRCKNGTVGAYDEYDDAWHNYQGKQSAGIAYTPAYAFIAAYKYAGATLSRTYLQNITLTYLL